MLKKILVRVVISLGHGLALGQDGQPPSQQCAIGPQEKMFGQTKWLLYGCDGATAAALVPAKGNPAAPFFFLIFRDGTGFKIYGEGIGDKNASGAAMSDLKSLPGEALAQIVTDAQTPRR